MGSTDESPGPERYRFGDVVVDRSAHVLSRAGELRPIEPKAFAVLLALIERPGVLVPRDDLLDQVWGHRHVTPGVLTRAIAQLRSALGDDPQDPRYIQTRHGLGYVFVGELLPEPESWESLSPRQVHALDLPVIVDAGAFEADQTAHMESDEAAMADAGSDTQQKPLDVATALAWQPRHWLLASLLATVVLALLLWSSRQVETRPSAASIAVMPFVNLGKDRSQDYFAEGLAVEMHDALAGVDGLKVAAQMSPGAAASREVDIKALGKRLGVAAILDASVQREGKRVRIHARLSDTTTGFTLWSNSYDRELSDIFAIQTEIAGEVVQSMIGALPRQEEKLEHRLAPTRSGAAFDSYLKGIWRTRQPEGTGGDEAAAEFRNALREDSNFARAQAWMCRLEVWNFESRRDADTFAKASETCRRAQAMDPALDDVVLAMGDLHRMKGDHRAAQSNYRKLIDAKVRTLPATIGLAHSLSESGQVDEAILTIRNLLDSQPEHASLHAELGYLLYVSGQVEQALQAYREAVRIDPHDADYWGMLGGLLLHRGNNEAAQEALERAMAITPSYHAMVNLGTIHYQAGRPDQSARLYRNAIDLSPDDFFLWGSLGDALAAMTDGRTGAEGAYRKAAAGAAAYLELRPEDSQALAALGWYQANIGEVDAARTLASKAESLAELPIDVAEVALFGSRVSALLGDREEARRRIAAARRAGITQARIDTHVELQQAGLVSGKRNSGKPAAGNGPEGY